jgi:hypothetical protein
VFGGGDLAFHAIDKATGKDLWSAPLRETTGTPIKTHSGRRFVRVATGRTSGDGLRQTRGFLRVLCVLCVDSALLKIRSP